MLQLALRAKPADRFLLVTDAMPSVGSDRDDFLLQGRRIMVRDGVCVDENGTLAGSAIDMATVLLREVRRQRRTRRARSQDRTRGCRQGLRESRSRRARAIAPERDGRSGRAFVGATSGALFGKAHVMADEVHLAMTSRG